MANRHQHMTLFDKLIRSTCINKPSFMSLFIIKHKHYQFSHQRSLNFLFSIFRKENGNDQYQETHQNGQEMAEVCSHAEEEDFISKI